MQHQIIRRSVNSGSFWCEFMDVSLVHESDDKMLPERSFVFLFLAFYFKKKLHTNTQFNIKTFLEGSS